MIKFAVIGTNWITQKFVQAAHESQSMQLAAVYSRNLDSAAQFAQEFDVEATYDSLDALANDKTVEGLDVLGRPCFTVQFHPEACPGPHDAEPLFDRFRELVDNHLGGES